MSVKNIIARFGRVGLTALTFILVTALLTTAQEKKTDEQKKQEKAAKAEESASKKQAKQERRYQRIVAFAREKRDGDPEFKEVVDDRYRSIREEHTRYAYLINTRPSNYKLVTRDGEKLRFEQALYDNPLAQDYVNRVGQSLVPPHSEKLYAFKIVQDPVPQARSLSTGTVYITTGLLSIIDSEAQLAYVLGHEIAHVEKDHWYDDVLVEIGTPFYVQKKEGLQTLFKSALSTVSAASLQRGDVTSGVIAASVLKLSGLDQAFQWENLQEDEADTEGMKYMFQRNYDVREIPKLYARMKELTKDPRSQTGFIADPWRIAERMEAYAKASAQFTKAGAVAGAVDLSTNRGKRLATTGARGIARMLNETMASEIQKKLEGGELIASGEEFQSVMALVKRDNGIRAFQFDMFSLARNNLEDSISIRSNDPSAFYYYGKVLKQTARNASEISSALASMRSAISADRRRTIAEPYLFQAMLRLADRNSNETHLITQDLRTYVEIYQRENAGALPPNMDFIYDVMQDFDVLDYRATPAVNTADAPRPVPGSRPAAADTAPPPPQTSAPTVDKPVSTPGARARTKKP